MGSSRWLKAFPLPEATRAVEALTLGWTYLASVQRSSFNQATIEPKLTLVLATYIRDVIAVQRKILGFWGVEDVKARVDFDTGAILSSTRTDIEYKWMDGKRQLQLVFEFKRLDGGSVSVEHYCGDNGLMRFVTGEYSINECVAVMAGIALRDRKALVNAIRKRLEDDGEGGVLQMQKIGGDLLEIPSAIFPADAEFDTQHSRPRGKAPAHGSIRVSHMFLEFGYPTPPTKKPARSTALKPGVSGRRIRKD